MYWVIITSSKLILDYLCTKKMSEECMWIKWTCRLSCGPLLSGYIAPFWLFLGNISPWDLVTVLLSPLQRYYGMLPTPIPIHFPHTSPILSLFCLSLPLPFTSQLLSFVLFDPTDLYCYCILPKVFTWGILVILFEIALDCVCSPYKKWPCAWWNVKCFFVLGLSTSMCTLCLLWTWTSAFHVWMRRHVDVSLGLVVIRGQLLGHDYSGILFLSLCAFLHYNSYSMFGKVSVSTFYTSIQGLVDLAGNL